MLLEIKQSCLLVIDVQQKLTPLVLNNEVLVKNCQWLLSLATNLAVTTFITEQYPKGLGNTIDTLQPLIKSFTCLEKLSFSVQADSNCRAYLASLGKTQIIVAGIETSVCILQTVLELLSEKKEVFVVVDAVSARSQLDHDIALQRMERAGAVLITKEMVFFEWLRTAETKDFKALSKQFLQ